VDENDGDIGGMLIYESIANIENTTISGNTCLGNDGGGIAIYVSSVSITNATICEKHVLCKWWWSLSLF